MTIATGVTELKAKLPNAIEEAFEFHGETTLIVGKESLLDALGLLKNEGYRVLIDLTGVDYLHPEKRTKVVYWLHNPDTLERIRVETYVKRQERLTSVISLWRGADWYERELYDLFGVEFEGRPAPERILMPDDWNGHPLRRDYALTEEPVQFKHGVKPKVPSEIIPYVKEHKKS